VPNMPQIATLPDASTVVDAAKNMECRAAATQVLVCASKRSVAPVSPSGCALPKSKTSPSGKLTEMWSLRLT